jgi:hypothetical protein
VGELSGPRVMEVGGSSIGTLTIPPLAGHLE